ncbi:MAG TPA: hypothetical protein VEJ20_08395 [Candidatus Eremiobacteraceae bacterium]|nr:hypothetical protein [Candidatus Eremiobacteraceae bacterium]
MDKQQRIALATVFVAATALWIASAAPSSAALGQRLAFDPSPQPATGGAAAGVPEYKHLEFDITTGGDDLRGNSAAYVVIENAAIHLHSRCRLKSGQEDGWENFTLHKVSCSLPVGTTVDQLKAASYTIQLLTNPDFGQADDNWNINAVHIIAYDPSSAQPLACVYLASGNPLERLKGYGATWVSSAFANHC